MKVWVKVVCIKVRQFWYCSWKLHTSYGPDDARIASSLGVVLKLELFSLLLIYHIQKSPSTCA